MTLLLNDPSEFEGGDLELMAPGKFAELKQGHAIIFASFLNHRVNVVKRGVRQSLVVWFGGKPFRWLLKDFSQLLYLLKMSN